MNWRGVLEHPSSDLVLAILGLIALNLLARVSTACLKRGNERASSLVESNLDRWSSSHAAAA
jgi:hypothetical protein